MMFKIIYPQWLPVLFSSLMLTTRLTAAIPAAENLLPADTFFLLTVPDCAHMRQVMGESPQMLLWNDPAMRPFHDRTVEKWGTLFTEPLETDLGLKLSTFLDLPQGQLTFAITRNGWDGQDESKAAGFVLLLDAKDQSDALKHVLDGLKRKWADAGKNIRTENIHGVTFSVVPLSTNDIPAALTGLIPGSQPVQELGQAPRASKPHQMVIGQYQSLLIVGNSMAAVEPIVSRLTGGSAPVLADNSIFEEDKASQFRNNPVYYSWLNAHALFDVIARIPAPEPNPNAPTLMPTLSPATVLNAAGLAGLKSVSLSYHQSHDGTLATVFFSAPEGSRQGLLKMLATSAKDASAPAFVPADTTKFWRWRLDGQKIWAELQKTLAGISPGVAGSVNGFIDMANGLAQQKDANFDLRKDLIGNLGDDWMSYDETPTGSPGLHQAKGVFLFASANPEQTVLAIKTAAALYAPQEGAPAPQEFLGHSIQALALRPQVSPAGATTPRSIYFTISSGYVAISTDISMLQGFLRSAGKPPQPLSQVPGLADAVQHIGGTGNGLFGYQDHRAEMQASFASLKNADAAGLMAQPSLAFLPKSFASLLDFSLLPDYEQVSKYFYFSVFSGTTTPAGITFRGFYPRPPQLN